MIIGITALPRSGKDTFFRYFQEYCRYRGRCLTRISFGDYLRHDLRDFIRDKYGIDVVYCTDEEKELTRPLLIAHGQCLRRTNPDTLLNRSKYKVRRVLQEENCTPVYTDVRYENEVDYIKASGGIVVHLSRERNPLPEPDSPELLQCLERGDIYFNLHNISFTGDERKDYEKYLNHHEQYFVDLYDVIKEYNG